MASVRIPEPASLDEEEIEYPDSDGQPMAETEVHILLMVSLIVILRNYYRKADDVYVIGNMFLYFREGHPECRLAPDIMVFKGVAGRKERRSWKTWEEEGAVPRVVFELTSKKTAKEGLVDKRDTYQELGVKEYFLFDPLHEYLPERLMGYRLVKGRYQAIAANKDGSMDSRELGLRLVPARKKLGLVVIKTGEKLLTPEQTHEVWEQVQGDFERLAKERDAIERELEAALRRATAAEQRIQELEAELRKTKGRP